MIYFLPIPGLFGKFSFIFFCLDLFLGLVTQLPKFNSEWKPLKNDELEDDPFLFGTVKKSGVMLNFQGVGPYEQLP